jgi:predicted kinase
MGTMGNEGKMNPEVKRIRLIRPSVVVLCGPAACGKSTFAERHFRPTQIVSSDRARALVCDDEKDQRFQAQAFALLHCLIEQRLSINRLCVVDSTALTQQARKSLLELARRFRVPSVVLLLDVPLATCLDRDAKRERTVGAPAIERQYQLFEAAKAAIGQEGFDQIVELGEQDLVRVEIEIVFRPVAKPAPTPVRSEDRRPGPGRPAGEDQRAARPNRRWAARDRGPTGPARQAQGVARPSAPPPTPSGAHEAAPIPNAEQSPAPSAAPSAAAPPAEPQPDQLSKPDKTSETPSGSQGTE